MAELSYPFDSNELSPDDLEVIRSFLEADDFETLPSSTDGLQIPELPGMPGVSRASAISPIRDDIADEEMLTIFTNEVRGDIEILRQSLALVEQAERLDSPGLLGLRRISHKIRGTSAAIGCEAISTIAHTLEILIDMAYSEQLELFTALIALSHAIGALQMTLESVETEKQESMVPLLALESDFEALNIHVSVQERDDAPLLSTERERGGDILRDLQHPLRALPLLLQHIEQVAGQQDALEEARQSVQRALAEMQTAQSRLRRVETYVAAVRTSLWNDRQSEAGSEDTTSSSLVARILREAPQRSGFTHQSRARIAPLPPSVIETITWDELELDNYTETSILAHALNEAVADIATATSQLQIAQAQLDSLVKQQTARVRIIRDNARALSSYEPYAHQQSVLGLLLRAGEQQVIVPFAQVQRIEHRLQDATHRYLSLNALLGRPHAMPISTVSTSSAYPTIILRDDPFASPETPHKQRAVQVDEVLGQVEMLVQRAPQPLRRRGIIGMAIDKAGAVLLVLDLPELIRLPSGLTDETRTAAKSPPARSRDERIPRIVIADDSIYIRRSLQQTLGQQGYMLFEARDGIEALERMNEDAPDVLLLDLEMPNLNGYDLLAIRRSRGLLPDLKIILLTSRTSQKHRLRAQELGIHAYLTKPCPDDVLRKTVEELLQR